MQDSIVISEKFSDYWKTALYISLAVALSAFLLFLNINDIVWLGIFRLGAFISFAVSVFCMLKVMEGKRELFISLDDNRLEIVYKKGNKVIREDNIDLTSIDYIYHESHSFDLPIVDFSIPADSTLNFVIKLHNSEDDFYLFEFGGSVLQIDQSTAGRLKKFFQSHNLYRVQNTHQT